MNDRPPHQLPCFLPGRLASLHFRPRTACAEPSRKAGPPPAPPLETGKKKGRLDPAPQSCPEGGREGRGALTYFPSFRLPDLNAPVSGLGGFPDQDRLRNSRRHGAGWCMRFCRGIGRTKKGPFANALASRHLDDTPQQHVLYLRLLMQVIRHCSLCPGKRDHV